MPKILRDALLLLGPPLVTLLGQDIVPALNNTNPHAAEVVAAVAALLTLIFTPLEKSYGVTGTKPVVAPQGVDPSA